MSGARSTARAAALLRQRARAVSPPSHRYARVTLLTTCITIGPVIVSFADRDTASLAVGRRVRRFAAIEKTGRRKLRQLEIAGRLDDLRVPPGNRLEALKGGRKGQLSIRINDQWRVCFTWTPAGPADVEIVDYH